MAKRPTRMVSDSGPRRRPRDNNRSVERSDVLMREESRDDAESAEDKEILEEAYERFDYADSWEADFRKLAIDDTKFANADSDNGWQWPDDMAQQRRLAKRPALTINKVQNHVNLVTNEARQNKAGIVIRPEGGEADYEAAQAIEGWVRNIEYQSQASAIYDDASQSQVECGIGYFGVRSVYPDGNSFDQELRIVPFESHLNVYLDPDIRQKSGSDADWGFVFSSVTDREYERQFKKRAPTGENPFFSGGADWVKPDHVRLAEYWRIVTVEDELIYLKIDQIVDDEIKPGEPSLFRKSELDKMPPSFRAQFRDAVKREKEGDTLITIQRRKVEDRKLEWYKIGGHKILDRNTDLKTKYIPIVRFVGRERVIEGKLERKGLVRSLKDAQRMYNYNSSAQAEYGAGASKSPWMVAIAAIAGNETAWNRANIDNKPYIPYRHRDADGEPIPAPTRPEAPGTSPAFLTGMEIAARELEMASGQGPASFGKPQREISGKAIGKTQRQGETITYDFVDNQAIGLGYLGMILLDWIPHVYDTKRVIQIMEKDGTEQTVTLDPSASKAFDKAKGEDDNKEVVTLNPNIGKYKVQATSGPAYSTQREEAWNAFVQIVTGSPDLINEIGDLMFQAADFPMADKIAERIKRKIRANAPYLLDDDAATPAMQQLQGQVQQATSQIGELLQQLAEKDRKLRDQTRDIMLKAAELSNKYRQTDISEYDAHSKRITAVSNAQPELNRTGDLDILKDLIQGMLNDANTDTDRQDPRQQIPDLSSEEAGVQDADPDQDEDFDEPRKAPDGNHYVKLGGKYHMVDPEHMAQMGAE